VPQLSLPGRFLRFALVGAAGYLVNLAVYTTLLNVAGVAYLSAATASFGVAVTHNYLLNRAWTFRDARAGFFGQGVRFLLVSLGVLEINLAVLHLLVLAGAPKVAAEAVAILVGLPVNFVGNRIWSFKPFREPPQPLPPVTACARPPTPLRAVVCLPTYNERENLPSMLAVLERVIGPRDVVLVIDDASPDGTGALADELARTHGFVHVMHRGGKAGLGRAYLDGFAYSLSLGAELVLQMDCDFSHDPNDVPRLIAAAAAADLAIGSRYAPGGSAAGLGRLRSLLSRGGCFYARTLLKLGVHDLTGGFKCYRSDALRRLGLADVTSSGYVFQVETTYRAVRAGCTVREIPIRFAVRRDGSSKMGLGIAAEALWKVPALRLRFAVAPLARPVRVAAA
jgi:dolichol-phosphate mannosyltransferase